MLKTKSFKGLLSVENDFYHLMFNMANGSVKQFIIRSAGNSDLYREGCEMWDENWGSFHPNHYQQERGLLISHKRTASSQQIQISFSSRLGISAGPPRLRGWCENNWLFQEDTPLILCNFKIGHDKDSQIGRTLFKKYMMLHTKSYVGWACLGTDQVVSGSTEKPRSPCFYAHRGQWAGQIPPEVEKTLGCSLETLPKWITFFSNIQGLALFLPDVNLWPDSSYFAVWTGGKSIELLYGCRGIQQEVVLSIGYLGYRTTSEKKWKPIERFFQDGKND